MKVWHCTTSRRPEITQAVSQIHDVHPSDHSRPGLVDAGRTLFLIILRAPWLAVEGSRRNLHSVKLLFSTLRRGLPMLEDVVVEDCMPKQDPFVSTRVGDAARERGCGLKGG